VILGIDVRSAYLRTLDLAREVLAAPEVTTAWDEPSALAEFRVRGLAGHLTRAGTLVEQYLDAGVPEQTLPVADAAEYYLVAALASDVDDPMNTAIRERGEAEAGVGPAALVEQFDAAVAGLVPRLAALPDDARIAVTAGMLLPLDEYLVTRIVELITHTDDLAVSVGRPTPEPDPVAATLAVHCLVSLARRRHGDMAVVRALTRRERDTVEALRAF
jgi:uncharacterized protein (TIGR03083 family)